MGPHPRVARQCSEIACSPNQRRGGGCPEGESPGTGCTLGPGMQRIFVGDVQGCAAELDEIITGDCKAGQYRFDLLPAVILGDTSPVEEVRCE